MAEDMPGPVEPVSRRGFLAAGGAGVVGLSFGDLFGSRSASSGSVVQIVLNGGASQLETFDPKPEAPREVRGPLHSIATCLPGVRFSECLPKLARRADRMVVLRSLFHDAAPIHETGLQLLLTGSLVRNRSRPPAVGAVLARLLPGGSRLPLAVELGGRLQRTGTSAYRGDDAGLLSRTVPAERLAGYDELHQSGIFRIDFSQAAPRVREDYGETRFGRLLWTAARLVQAGVRYVAVHTFDALEGERTWDAHGCSGSGPATLFDYRDTLGPEFDRAAAAFLDDLQRTGLWKSTFVVCAGEMGRAPRLNGNAGRDHWTRVWSGFLAGGMLAGGQVIGGSDARGEEVQESPVDLSQLAGLMYEYLGIPRGTEVHGADGRTWLAG